MKTISIKRDSFSYKLATKFSNYRDTVYSEKEGKRVPNNICAFRRALIWSSIISLLLLIALVLSLVSEAHFFAYLTSCVVNHVEFKPNVSPFVFMGMILNVIVFVSFGTAVIIYCAITFSNLMDKLKRASKKSDAPKPPSGIKLAWESFKGKYCHPVEIQ